MNSLWRACVFAHPVGWAKGFRDSNGNMSSQEDQQLERGDIIASPDSNKFAVQDMGRSISNIGGSADKFVWPNIASRYDPGGDTMSAAVLFRPNELNHGQSKTILSMSDDDAVFTPSYTFQIRINDFAPQVNEYEFALRIAGNKTLLSGVSAIATRTDMLVCTYDGANMRIYYDGVEVASKAQTGTPTQSGFEVRIFGQTSNDSTRLRGYVGMAAIWSRVITLNEIKRLHADPYQMWKGLEAEEGQAGAEQVNTYFNAF